MSRRSRSSATRRGFSLIEALVSLTLMVIVLVVTMSLLFAMRSFAERQQLVTQPRQSARGAMDYLTYFVEGASDNNPVRTNPNAIISYYNRTTPLNVATLVQATYNNLTGAETGNATVGAGGFYTNFGDAGTDILTLAMQTNPVSVQMVWPVGKLVHAGSFGIDFRGACPDDTANLALFKQVTNVDSTGTASGLLSLVDSTGAYAYFRITNYGASNCALAAGQPASPPITVFNVTAGVGPDGNFTDPPGVLPAMTPPVVLKGGTQYLSFRVRTPTNAGVATGPPNLEQRFGLFNPQTDNPGTAFTPIVENVEDMQVAYAYATSPDGANYIFNTSAVPYPIGVAPNGVPPQIGNTGAPTNYDISRIIGLRMTLTGRSVELPEVRLSLTTSSGAGSIHFRPAAEDHAAGAVEKSTRLGGRGLFDHYRATTTLLLRNRILGS